MTYFYKRHLPHIQPAEAIYFITFRLYNSLPAHLILALQQKYLALSKEERSSKWFDYFEHFDRLLHEGATTPPLLSTPAVADIVSDTLRFWNGKRYDLAAYCIMPNHVHFVLDTHRYLVIPYSQRSPYPLTRIMESIKRHSARHGNLVLNRSGRFWQKESYDRVVRDGAELERVMRYIIENPVQAGLVQQSGDWRWSYYNEKYLTL